MNDLIDGIKSFFGKRTSAESPPKIGSLLFSSLFIVAVMTATCCILVTTKQFIGDNINCVASGVKEDEIRAIETYCFIAGTFTVTNMTMPAAAPHPGVGPIPYREVYPPGSEPDEFEGTTHHAYYQWVPFMLIFQSVLLYIPVKLWNHKQKDYFTTMLCELNHVHVDKQEAKKKSEESAKLFSYTIRYNNWSYFVCFILFEVLGFAIALINLFITNLFLGDKFFYFGQGSLAYLSSSVTDPNNPLNEVFPKMGKCIWHKYGPSGSIQTMDALCVLPLNIVNEKTYIVLWVAYITIVAITAAVLLYHLVIFIIPRRLDAIIVRRATGATKDDVRLVLKHCDIGDKFMMWNLQSKMTNFSQWMEYLLENRKGK